ncbi:MAG: carbohydrate ABC transporter permease [Clostridia bacterium]
MDKYFKRWFGILVLPAVLLFVLVIALPFFTGIVYSFTSWRGTYFAGGTLFQSFVGFDNYIKAFTTGTFTRSLWYTVAYTVVAVIAINLVALAFALMLGSIHRGVGMYRTVFFMPNMLGGLAMGYVWQFIFQVVRFDF